MLFVLGTQPRFDHGKGGKVPWLNGNLLSPRSRWPRRKQHRPQLEGGISSHCRNDTTLPVPSDRSGNGSQHTQRARTRRPERPALWAVSVAEKGTWWVPAVAATLTLVAKEGAAPASRRTAATSTWPSRAEMCRGVYPFVVAASGCAMCWSSSCTISVLPRREAMCRGVCSSCNPRQVKGQCPGSPMPPVPPTTQGRSEVSAWAALMHRGFLFLGAPRQKEIITTLTSYSVFSYGGDLFGHRIFLRFYCSREGDIEEGAEGKWRGKET